MPKFDRWNYSGIYLAASVKRSACTLGKTLTYSGTYGLMGMIILVCWQQIGYMMIIYISGIQNIPGELIEAAKIDGANSWQVLRKVIIPMVMPSITICTFLTLTNGFKLFDQNLALTNGAPSKMSELLALNIFNTFYGRAGYEGVGQAKAVIFFSDRWSGCRDSESHDKIKGGAAVVNKKLKHGWLVTLIFFCYQPAVLISDHSCCDQLIQEESLHQSGAI